MLLAIQDTSRYLQQNNFKTCQGCRGYKRLHKHKENTPPQPTEQEQYTTGNKQHKRTCDHIINNKIEQVLVYEKPHT